MEYNVTPEETNVDSPEYIQSMVDKAGQSAVQDLNSEDESLILGKFKDIEALADAYKQLESKLGQPTEEPPPTEQVADTEAAALDLKRPDSTATSEDTTDESSAIFEDFGKKYAENGEFTDEDYKALADKGFPKEVVQIYEHGLRALQQARTSAAAEAVGGSDALKQIQSWAGQNLSDGELSAFNKQLSQAQTPEEVGVIYATLRTKYQAASGEATLVSGSTATPKGAAFANRSEMVKAMSDPRYGTDPNFTREVEQKVSNSDFL